MNSLWQNSYKPPSNTFTDEDLYGPASAPFELNFCFPITPEHLEKTLTNTRSNVRLEPFVPRVHGAAFAKECKEHPEIFDWLPLLPPPTERELLTLLHSLFRHDPKNVLFAVMVPKPVSKPESVSDTNATLNTNSESVSEWEMAGCLGILRASPYTLSAELGPAMTFTRFQRTHVTSNAIGLALRYCLNLPSDTRFQGLGMRRVEWQANPLNVASVRAAERMGFKKEGVIRWTLPLPPGRSGYEPREGDPLKDRKGRDSVYLSVCCDDWESGVREKVEATMEIRRS